MRTAVRATGAVLAPAWLLMSKSAAERATAPTQQVFHKIFCRVSITAEKDCSAPASGTDRSTISPSAVRVPSTKCRVDILVIERQYFVF
jgi:hypothetical protein